MDGENEQNFSPKFSVHQVIGELRLLLKLIWLWARLGSQETAVDHLHRYSCSFLSLSLEVFQSKPWKIFNLYGTKISTVINVRALLMQGRLWLIAQIKPLVYSSQWAQIALCVPVSKKHFYSLFVLSGAVRPEPKHPRKHCCAPLQRVECPSLSLICVSLNFLIMGAIYSVHPFTPSLKTGLCLLCF